MNYDNFTKQYNAFLKEKIKEYCNEDGCWEIYWDYTDEIEPSTILEAYSKYKEEGYEKVEDYIENELFEINLDCDSELFSSIKNDLENSDFYTKEFEKWYMEKCNIYEDLQRNGYNGISLNLKELLDNSTFYFNIMLATEQERNYDMGSIVTSFGTYHFPDYDYLNEQDLDNALTYLIHQQGYTCKEYFDILENNSEGFSTNYKCNFIESIVDDVVNNTSEAMSELTVLVKMNGKKAIEFLNYLDNKEENQNLIFNKNCEIGIFNEWAGCGGLLEIKLEKDFIVPKNMIRRFQIEGAKNQGYTVDEVYGLIRSCWKECMEYTDKEPELVKEDMKNLINYLQENYVENEEIIE